MIPDMLSNKNLNQIVTQLFITGWKLTICLVFITQSHFAVPKNIRLNSAHYFSWKLQIKQNFNKSHLIIHQDFMNLSKRCTAKPYLFLVIDTTLASDNSSRFRKNF